MANPDESTDGPLAIGSFPLHLGLGATAIPQPEFTGEMAWFGTYAETNAADGTEGRLVTMSTFADPWDMWEMHPNGHEVVLCTDGSITLHQEAAGVTTTVTLAAGEYAVNPPGVWHTADVDRPATVLFITAGLGTEHRAR